MNCRPGDLAIVINAGPDSAVPRDAIVRCIRFYSGPAEVQGEPAIRFLSTWLVEYRGQEHIDGYAFQVPDQYLRPIRDNEGEDETLQWAPVPVKEIA